MLLDTHHLIASLNIQDAALELTTVMPQTDAVIELQELIDHQFNIIVHILQNQHYGSERLNEIIDQTRKIVEQVKTFEET